MHVRADIPGQLARELAVEAEARGVPVEVLLHERYTSVRNHGICEPHETGWPVKFEFACGVHDNEIPPKRYLSHTKPRTCLFCGGTAPRVSFKKDAHIIPAAFGNRSLFSKDECDACNERAGRLFEQELVNSLIPDRALWGLRKRDNKGITHTPQGQSYIRSSGLSTEIVIVEGDPSITTKELPEGLEISIVGPRYRPMAVAKSLARLALFVLGHDEASRVSWLLDWLRGSRQWYPVYAEAFFSGSRRPDYALKIYQTHMQDIPYCVELGTGNIKYAMGLPVSPPSEPPSSDRVWHQLSYRMEDSFMRLIRVVSEEAQLDSSKTYQIHGTVVEPVSEDDEATVDASD